VRWIKFKESLFLALLRGRGGRRDIRPPPPALRRLVENVLCGRERPAGGGRQGRSRTVRLRPHLHAATVVPLVRVRARDVARVGMEGVRTARGRVLYRSHRGGRFATGFQSPFAPVSNDDAGARGGVWVIHATWEDLSPPTSHAHLAARALPPPLPKCGGGEGGEGQEAVFGVSREARGHAPCPCLENVL
jgi:hypothetical protein